LPAVTCLRCAQKFAEISALFSGLHGISALVGEYENVLMIASGFGVAAYLPYLKRLIHGYNARRVHARQIHLVWQLSDM
jgi:Ferric reductase NAD binding domain